MSNLSKGKYAQFISDRSGQAFPYQEMVIEWNRSRVHISEFEAKHPQLEPRPTTADGQGLLNARPNLYSGIRRWWIYDCRFNFTWGLCISIKQWYDTR